MKKVNSIIAPLQTIPVFPLNLFRFVDNLALLKVCPKVWKRLLYLDLTWLLSPSASAPLELTVKLLKLDENVVTSENNENGSKKRRSENREMKEHLEQTQKGESKQA